MSEDYVHAPWLGPLKRPGRTVTASEISPEHARRLEEQKALAAKEVAEKHFTQPTEEQKKAGISPFGLPPLLEARRMKYFIPDPCFSIQPVFDRVYLYQIAVDESHGSGQHKVEGTDLVLHLPQSAEDRAKEEAARGVLVAAGLHALDTLRSHGIDIGHIVTFARLAPMRLPLLEVRGCRYPILMVRDGDINGSEDLAKSIRSGECRYETMRDAKGIHHFFVDKKGQRWIPQETWIPEEY